MLLDGRTAQRRLSLGQRLGGLHVSIHVIEVGGGFVGAAITYSGKSRFVAMDPRTEELDESEWSSLSDVQRVVRHLPLTGCLPRASNVASRRMQPEGERSRIG
jgi:hypothetical protein